MTPANSASSSAFRINPELTKKNPPGSANALISSESMTLIVNGTLQSEFLTMFCPTRLTYSRTTGSVMNFVLFSIWEAYILPILISPSMEYQLPIPRPPISRLPTALTSSMLPGFTLIFWLPGSTTLSGSTATASVSPPTGVVPGAGCFLVVVDGVCPPTAAVPGARRFVGAVDGVSPPTGVVPGAGWAVGGVDVLAGVVLVGVDCAHSPVASASDNPASATALEPLKSALMTSPPARPADHSASLVCLDASILPFGNRKEE